MAPALRACLGSLLSGLASTLRSPSPRGWAPGLPRGSRRAEGLEAVSSSSDAEVRAAELLRRMLDKPQRKELEHGYFSVEAPGHGKFWIFAWRSLNVVDPRTGDCYCCTPEVRVPLADLMLAQKLLLECDPERFFAIANRQPQFLARPGPARTLVPGS